jgi:hypothetical protein
MRRVANGVRNYIRAAALSNGGNGTTIAQQVAVILAKYGTDAHVYLPGIGVINGLTAGNYLDSAGTTAATVDNPVGLVLDAAGSVGSEIKSIGTLSQLGVSTASTYNTTTGVGTATRVDATNQSSVVFSVTADKLHRFEITNTGAASVLIRNDSAGGALLLTVTAGTSVISYISSAAGRFVIAAAVNGQSISFTVNSVKEVTGIHAIQSTTANKPVLRRTNGRYWWDMVDGTDLLSATYPAGWESVTTIDAAPTGQATLTAQNIVGTYAITTDTYGRFVFKTITASELATIQTFANRLAGL